MKTFLWLLFGVVSALGCAVAALVILASMYPGVKGPHVSDDQMTVALVIGAGIGVGAVILIHRLVKGGRPLNQ